MREREGPRPVPRRFGSVRRGDKRGGLGPDADAGPGTNRKGGKMHLVEFPEQNVVYAKDRCQHFNFRAASWCAVGI